ncbi:MAG: serine/threonine-protein kinase [Acidobacteriaceae bacterium]
MLVNLANRVMDFMNIDSQKWEQLQELFHLAAAAPKEERGRLLTEACPDPEVRQRVMAIVTASEAEPGPHTERNHQLNSRIGPYHLIRHLGTGGIGSVYLAERLVGGTPHRFALKVLAQHVAGPQFVERFHREQHILASLEHPNITRMLDAGLNDSGNPYLVMEYVNGTHLDAHCDAHLLGVRERLELFLQLCDAVAYAHRNLIVHLDLKPSNILVTGEGVVKLLDFGTSKIIEPDSLLTTTIMATPAYASPEQLRNEPVTTACDIYSLGAVLFELLSGRRPGGKASVAIMIERAMKEQELERLDSVASEDAAGLRGLTLPRMQAMLKGDLETIVSKCLRPRPKDRYLSVDAVIEDLRRYLANRPVLAAPHTTLYRIGKFVRRNRKVVAASAAASLLLIASLTYAAVRQQQALREARRSVQMQAFMAQLFKLASTNYMGKPAATVPEFLKLGSVVLPQMIKNPSDQRTGENSLAESMFFDADFEDAEGVLSRVIASAKTDGDIPSEAEAEAYAGMVAYKLGKMQDYTALSSHALQLADKPGVTPATRVWIKTFYTQNRYELGYTNPADIAIQRSAVKEAHSPRVPPNELAYATLNLALVDSNDTTVADQQKLAQEAVTIYRNEPYAICETAAAEQVLGFLQQQTGDLQGSVRTFRDSYRGYSTCRGSESHDALVASAYLGLSLLSAGQPREAITIFEATIQKMDKVIGPDSLSLMAPLSGVARAYLDVGASQKSEDASARLFHIMDGKVNPNSSQLGIVHLTWARALAAQHKDAEALAQAKLADDGYRNEGSKLPGAIANAKRAHNLVLDLQAKLSPGAK